VRRLVDLRPEWLTTGGLRYGMGVEFTHPTSSQKRVRAWFSNPVDGDKPIRLEFLSLESGRKLLYTRAGYELRELTLGEPVEVEGGIPSLWVVEGEVWERPILGVAW
jgi:hypothetical protein